MKVFFPLIFPKPSPPMHTHTAFRKASKAPLNPWKRCLNQQKPRERRKNFRIIQKLRNCLVAVQKRVRMNGIRMSAFATIARRLTDQHRRYKEAVHAAQECNDGEFYSAV